MESSNGVLRILNSLCHAIWNSTSVGELEPDAEIMELITWLVGLAIDLRAKEEVAS